MTSAAIGVVVAMHNGARTLRDTIKSIQAQTQNDLVCVLVDDASTDNSVAIARDLLDERFFVIEQEHGGTSAARNCGLTALPPSVEYVTFLDQDDVWEPDALAILLRAATADPRLAGAHGLGRFIDEKGMPFDIGEFEAFGRARIGCAGGRAYPWPIDRPTTFESLLLRCTAFPPGLILARRGLYDQLGGFDPKVRLTEDWDMITRLSRHGDFAFVDRVVISWRKYEGNASADQGMIAAYDQVRAKTFWSSENSAELDALVRDAWRALQGMHAGTHADAARRELSERRILTAAKSMVHAGVALARKARGRPPRPR